MNLRDWLAVHFIREQGRGLERFRDREGFVVAVGGVKKENFQPCLRLRRTQNTGQRNAFPTCVTHEAAAHRIADATERCELFGGR